MSRPRKAVRSFFSCRTPGTLRRLRDAGDDGFTLIELIIVVIILPLVIGAIAVALLVTFRAQVGVSTRVSASADAQITSAYFVRDVESAGYLTTTKTPSGAAWPATAGRTAFCGTGTSLILSLAWPNGQQPIHSAATVVSYWALSNHVLEREFCKGNTSASASITSRAYLSPFANALLSCISSEPSCATTAGAKWIPAKWVTSVTLSVTSSVGKYAFSLTASPRAGVAGGTFASVTTVIGDVPPLLALGTGLNVVTETGAAGTTLIKVVTGPAVLNTGYFSMSNGTTFTAPKIEVVKTPCNKKTYPKAKCTGTIKPPKPWTKLAKPLPDPFAGLADPTPTTLGLPLITTCSPHTGVLKPGQYDCGGATPVLSTGGTVTLAHGVYILDTGLKLNGTTLQGTTILIYLPCGKTDKWVPNDTQARASKCTESFQVTGGQVVVSPLGTPPYASLWFWQNVGDTKGVFKAEGKGALRVTTGVLYAPGATVILTGLGTALTTVGAVIASTFRVSNAKVQVKGFGTS